MAFLLDTPAAVVTRTSLRDATKDRIRALIVAGDLAPGVNIVERELSACIGVSRTPLREALLGLEAEGLLYAEPGRGFFVTALSVDEARELYPLIGTLESMAVRRGRPSDLSGLRALGAAFRGAATPEQALTADHAWHEALVAKCRCPRTAALVTPLRIAAARYEFRYFSTPATIRASADQHDAAVRLLQRGRSVQAAAIIKKNWEQGLEWVERNLRREQSSVSTDVHQNRLVKEKVL